MKSCITCPFYTKSGVESVSTFRKSAGVPMCGKFGTPLGTLNSSEADEAIIAEYIGNSCSSHGETRKNVSWNEAKMIVAIPDPATMGRPPTTPELVSSCAGCQFFVREDIVAENFGFAAAACAARGKLLMSNRYTVEARNCPSKSWGPVRTTTRGMTLLPEYEDGFLGLRDPARRLQMEKENFVDPSEYESDKEVTGKDWDAGIRAWRKIHDMLSGNSVYLPIYRLDYFSEADQKLIPSTGDDEHPEDYVDHGNYVYKVSVLWTELDETPAFWGQAGTGKTEFYRHMAYLMQAPFYRFSITGSTELDDLAGKMHYTEGTGTHFEYGRMVKAWMSPCVMVVDEPNAGPPDVWQFLRPMTDNSKQLVLDQANGERITRHTDCFLGMAMNPAWDPLNVGTQPIGDADANRLMHLYVELPGPELEKEIIKTRCLHDGWEIPKDKLKMIMGIAKDIRALSEQQTLPITWAIRPQLKVARALRWFDAITAYKMASADFLEPEQQKLLLDIVKTHSVE